MSPEERIAELQEIVEELRRQNAELQKALEQWKRGFRQRGKRFSSRAETRKRVVCAKTPGRKQGHVGSFRAVPEVIHETVDYAVPNECLCGGVPGATGEVEQVIEEEIPETWVKRIAHRASVGKCARCGHRVLAKLPGASPTGQPFARVVLGPRAQALALSIRFEHHVSHRSTSRLMGRWFGLSVTAGGLSHLSTRRAKHTALAKEEIRAHVKSAPVVGADETGFRQSGKAGWVWIFRTPSSSFFEVSPRRGGGVLEASMGRIEGVLVSDFYSVYTARTDIAHSYCGAHLIRDAKEIAELDPSPVTREFADKLVALYKKGETATDFESRESVRNTFRWMTVVPRFRKHPDLALLSRRIENHFEGVVAFLGRDDIPWNNNATERDIRPFAVHRKVVGSTRSPSGSSALAHWMSVTQTLRKNGSNLAEWLPVALDAWRKNDRLPSLFT